MLNRILRKGAALGFLGGATLLAACADSSGEEPAAEPAEESVPITLEALVGNWEIQSAGGVNGLIKLDRPALLTVRSDGSFSLDAGCNNMGGTFSLEDGQLTSTPLASTRMACSEPVSSFEYLAGEIFMDVTAASLRAEDTLIVEAPAGDLRFQKR